MIQSRGKYFIEIALFVSGAVGMIIEIVGSRLMAPYFGNSLFVWTALIGVVLGALSFGYFIGGKLADKELSLKIFSSLLLFASILIMGLYIADFALMPDFLMFSRYKLLSIVAAIMLFGPPSIALGMISPYGIRLKIENLKHSGSTIGNLYAISTLGSITGTFMAGFVLLAYLGSVNIVLLLSAVMASLSSLFLVRGEKKKFVVICLMILLAVTIISVRSYSKKKDFDTAYDRYMIVEGKYGSDSRLVRFLTRDYNSSDSAVYLDGDSNLVFDYTKFYRVASHFLAQPKNALMIGGGTFTYPKDFLRKNPDSKITVVEIDPGLLQIAKDYFFYQDDSRQKLVFEDGRTYLNQNQEKYDLLIMDAYKSDTSIPFQLTTRETLMHCYDAMNDNGVIVSNVIGSIRGDRDKFIKAEYRTFASVFPQVKLYAVNDPTDQKLVQNFILVGIKNHTKYDNSDSNFEIAQDLKNEISLPADFGQDVPILTDDYAPVENYVNQL